MWRPLLALLLTSTAFAQQVDLATKTQADALFDDGKKLMANGQYDKACADFEGSVKLMPQVGVELNLADCYEKAGRTASASAQWRVTAAAAEKAGDSRAEYARKRVVELEPRLDKLIVKVGDKHPGLEVKRDGQALIALLYDKEVPVDQGLHEVVATAPGQPTFTQQIQITGESKTFTVEVPDLSTLAGEQPPPPPTTQRIALPPPATKDGHGQRVAGVVIGAAGAASLVVSGVFALLAKSAWSDAQADGHCVNGLCDSTGRDRHDSALADADLATITLAVGAGALAIGAVVYLTAPHGHAKTEVTLVPAPGGLSLDGRF
jgi:hypothetical protein